MIQDEEKDQQDSAIPASETPGSGAHSDFDPTDPKWRVSARFGPDKMDRWTYPISEDPWTLAHDALRGEVRDFGRALQNIAGVGKDADKAVDTNIDVNNDGSGSAPMLVTERQIVAMQSWWKGHLLHLSSHHHNEDLLVERFVRNRFHYPDFMTTDHDDLKEHTDRLDEIISKDASTILNAKKEDRHAKDESRPIENLNSNTTLMTPPVASAFFGTLLEAWQQYEATLLLHLQTEEDCAIPLLRAYFGPTRVQIFLTNRLAQAGPAVETGSIVHYVGKEKLGRNMIVHQKVPPILAKLSWALILGPRHRKYEQTMLSYLADMNNLEKDKQ